jgi:hypothetical protein
MFASILSIARSSSSPRPRRRSRTARPAIQTGHAVVAYGDVCAEPIFAVRLDDLGSRSACSDAQEADRQRAWPKHRAHVVSEGLKMRVSTWDVDAHGQALSTNVFEEDATTFE